MIKESDLNQCLIPKDNLGVAQKGEEKVFLTRKQKNWFC